VTASVMALANPQAAGPAAPYGATLEAALSCAGFTAAYGEIATWPGYAPTPLVALPAFAREVRLGAVLYKDEAGRFGLASFKPLGGAYAVARVLARELKRRGIAEAATAADFAAGRYAEAVCDITITSATDGNHGRSVAWGARMFGCKAVIVIHETVSEGRRAAIAAFGAEVVRVAGGYDDSVRHAFAEAAKNGWHVVQDTATATYREVPADITYGYGVIAEEIVQEIAEPPTHVIVQAGVGGVASAICARFWQHLGARRPKFIVLEPVQAACVAASLRAGRRADVTGDIDSVMAGLACGEVSELAWEVLATGANGAIVIDDDWALAGMRRLASPVDGDPAIVAGECSGGAAGALMALADREDLRAVLGLDATSRVLVIGTEGATDPEIYMRIVGRTPAEVVSPSSCLESSSKHNDGATS